MHSDCVTSLMLRCHGHPLMFVKQNRSGTFSIFQRIDAQRRWMIPPTSISEKRRPMLRRRRLKNWMRTASMISAVTPIRTKLPSPQPLILALLTHPLTLPPLEPGWTQCGPKSDSPRRGLNDFGGHPGTLSQSIFFILTPRFPRISDLHYVRIYEHREVLPLNPPHFIAQTLSPCS
ncbi:uncharacterized protein EI90DRAFT_3031452 [Cantharellus anzutake]|uniref:uncharacterized protein n=1 Tax=Cantharellus anzutake TaxID=1750568 RepID=UPI001904B27E|nr:uncharacterized protein EI90DRAFT_3031452 [Cantharellus anzutake]KAF8343133.1 hypothetical protein EI90DRAFT_3031452 [Cantharellus anzutake]